MAPLRNRLGNEMLTGTNQTHVQACNQRIVLDAIRRYAPISRAEIAQMTNLTRQTISNIVSDLISSNLVVEGQAQKRKTSGSRAIGLLLNPSGGYSVGIHLERTYLTGVLLDLSGTVRERVTQRVDFPEPDVALTMIEKAARHLLDASEDERQKVVGVGVSLPGPLFTDKQQFVYADNLPNWQGVPVQDALAARLKLPTVVENDATAAAVGERWYGAGKGYRNFFFIYLGVGLGGGVVINGQPYRGVQGNAGEFSYSGAKVDGEYIEQIGKQVSLTRLYREFQN